jgi:hypothetical protein
MHSVQCLVPQGIITLQSADVYTYAVRNVKELYMLIFIYLEKFWRLEAD